MEPPDWNHLSEEQKIEALHDAVENLRKLFLELQNSLHRVTARVQTLELDAKKSPNAPHQ